MANKLYEESNIQAIANAIRAKGQTGTMTVAQMAGKIANIETGIEPQEYEWQQTPEAVQDYLDYIAAHPYSTSDYSTSYFDNYTPPYADKPTGKTINLPAGTLAVRDANGHSYSVVVSAGDKIINSVIPNAKTEFSVEDGGSILAVGVLEPTGSRRFIDGTTYSLNMRDLGGMACDGGTIKYGKIIRGGEVYVGDPELAAILHDIVGVRAELDLLGEASGESPFEYSDVDYCCPVDGDSAWAYYSLIHTDNMRQAFRFIFDSARRGRTLYVHCQQGADRTGTISLLIEALLGVPQNICDVDYELTCFSNKSENPAIRKRNDTAYQSFLTKINALTGSTFRDKIVNYIASLGFTAEEINDFREAMIDGNPQSVTPSIEEYSVENELSYVSSDNDADEATQYQPYVAKLTANSGYVINSVQVMMGGVDVTSQVFSGAETNLYRGVTKTLSNCSANVRAAVINGQDLVCELTADDGYTLDESEGASIVVTMGGTQIYP